MMDMSYNLRKAGLKSTPPRIKVLSLFLSGNAQHLGAEEIYRRLLAEGEEIGLATIYRVLTQFEQAGLLTRHHFEGGKAVFEVNQGDHHDHFVCIQCGKVEEFFDESIEKRQKEMARERGFTVHDHALHIYVECNRPECSSTVETRRHRLREDADE